MGKLVYENITKDKSKTVLHWEPLINLKDWLQKDKTF
jgi:hypothetical protein